MAAIRGRNTRPEVAVRRAVHAAGFRFRLHRRDILGHPDLAFPRYRIAVFVNGCFWHGHSCKFGHIPKSNMAYWEAKIGRNITRDAQNVSLLRQSGWEVMTIWECAVAEDCDKLIAVLKKKRRQYS